VSVRWLRRAVRSKRRESRGWLRTCLAHRLQLDPPDLFEKQNTRGGYVMSDYQFVLKLEGNGQLVTQVRVWIDDQLSSDLSSEQEIELMRESEDTWVAEFDAADVFMYRVGIVAAEGAQWSLSFSTTGDKPRELLFDSDELTLAKEWLVGTCEAVDGARLHRLGLAHVASGALS
jgi:hypothetical protein